MSGKRLTKAQLVQELAQVTQERDDAWIALASARERIAEYDAQSTGMSEKQRLRLPPRLVQLQREVTPQGEFLRAGETRYRAAITPRADGMGYQVIAPAHDARPLRTTLDPGGIGHLPEHVLQRLMRA